VFVEQSTNNFMLYSFRLYLLMSHLVEEFIKSNFVNRFNIREREYAFSLYSVILTFFYLLLKNLEDSSSMA
jgi:hypothetical protein